MFLLWVERAARICNTCRMPTPARIFARATDHHRAGRTGEAERDYLDVLAQEQENFDALRLLGALYLQTGKLDRAAQCLEQACAANPRDAETLNNLGVALGKAGRLEEAIARYEAALRRDPHYAQARGNLSGAYVERGVAMLLQSHLPEAAAQFERALLFDVANVRALNNLGNLRRNEGKADEAAALYRRALAAKPDYAEAYINLAVALRDGGAHDAALEACAAALRLKPDSAEALVNKGLLLQDRGGFDEAIACYDAALRARPDFTDASWNKALALLAQGKYREGWALHEAGLGHKRGVRLFAARRWNGEPLAGRRLLIWSEQGYGDTLQFVRYAQLCKERGAHVTVQAPAALMRLLKICPFIDRVVSEAHEEDFDYQIAMMSFPFAFGTELETVPASVPYLFVDDASRAKWAAKCAGEGRKIGLVWAGNARRQLIDAHLIDKRRSLDLRELKPLFELAGNPPASSVPRPLRAGTGVGSLARRTDAWSSGSNPPPAKSKDLLAQVQDFATSPARGEEQILFFSLQKGAEAAQIDAAGLRGRIIDLMPEAGDFLDTAALIEQLDLVITVDTAVAHLAGALGKTVWILSRYDACWRWLQNRESNPWYPTAQVFGQTSPGDWPGVVARVRNKLF
jgi:tetratricopeptide (TPR) repeat protein/ADP-heptose:LPS heptosyltransferase